MMTHGIPAAELKCRMKLNFPLAHDTRTENRNVQVEVHGSIEMKITINITHGKLQKTVITLMPVTVLLLRGSI